MSVRGRSSSTRQSWATKNCETSRKRPVLPSIKFWTTPADGSFSPPHQPLGTRRPHRTRQHHPLLLTPPHRRTPTPPPLPPARMKRSASGMRRARRVARDLERDVVDVAEVPI